MRRALPISQSSRNRKKKNWADVFTVHHSFIVTFLFPGLRLFLFGRNKLTPSLEKDFFPKLRRCGSGIGLPVGHKIHLTGPGFETGFYLFFL